MKTKLKRLALIWFLILFAWGVVRCGGDSGERQGDRPSPEQIAQFTARRDSMMRHASPEQVAQFMARRDSMTRHGGSPGMQPGMQTGKEGMQRRPDGQSAAREGMTGMPSRQMPGAPRGQALIPVEVGAVERRDMADYILASTTLEALRAIEVYAKTTGIVRDLLVEEGTRVGEGDTLVILDDREARINLRRAEIEFREAENALNRSREMRERNLISEEDFETAQLAYERAGTSLNEARLAMEYTRVMPPITGTITERFVELGSMVSQGTVLFRLADFNPLRARIFVPEKELRRLRVGQDVLLTIESEPAREFPAVVKLISSVIDPSSGTFKVTVEIQSSGGILRPGMFASVRIIVDRHAGTTVVPSVAVLYEGKQRYLYVVREGTAERIEVETGFRDKGCVEIFGPVEEGEWVVVAGQNNLTTGIKVEVVREVSDNGPERCDELEEAVAPQRPQAGRGD